MGRKIYISDERFDLAEYICETDAEANYACWQDIDTQRGYNYKTDFTLEEFKSSPNRARFRAVAVRKSDGAVVGTVSLSPEGSLPDLAIMLYKPYRGFGYSTPVFALALQYCFEHFGFEYIYAGCYEGNVKSRKMLANCGFVPHPEGNCNETHFEDGTPIIQYDFVKYRI